MMRSTGTVSEERVVTKASPRGVETEDTAVYEAFVRRHCTSLVRSLTLLSLDPELAADAAQEAFIQLFKHWDEVQRHGSPEAWLYRVAINRCTDHRRRLARAARLFRRLAAATPSDALVRWDAEDEGLHLLEGLPKRQRAAAVLYFGADFSVAQVAEAMGISEGAVKSHLARARETLRATLEEES